MKLLSRRRTELRKSDQVSEVWDLEQFLTKRRSQIDRQFDYRYSVLIQVFGDLLHRGNLHEQELQGLSDDKIAAIRRYASFLASPVP